MVCNPCSILISTYSKIMINRFSGFIFLLSFSVLVDSFGAPPRNSQSNEKEYTFPGTGFFSKDRSPYQENEARSWFIEANRLQKKGNFSKALSLYEKFSKRRSDAIVKSSGVNLKIGPESLFRASILREKKGDWQKAFQHLRLIAEAYVDYDFERVAESLMRIAERLAKEDLPRKWGIFPRFRSGNQDRLRLDGIARLARGPKFAPRALMALSEIALNDEKDEEAVDALERIINLYPENFLAEKAYFLLAKIFEERVAGPSYDQGSTLKALNFYEDYLILYSTPPPRNTRESKESFKIRIVESKLRLTKAEKGRNRMRQTLAESKVEVAQYLENYGKYFLVRWKELGDRPALQFYNEAITTAPESQAARIAEKKVAELRARNE